jgi:hypothetical protein
MRCVPRCTSDALCGGPGYVCGDAGLCVAARCDLHGYVCPPFSQCSASSVEADSHGCLHDECTQDADCERGVCVEGRCWASAGRCVLLTCA